MWNHKAAINTWIYEIVFTFTIGESPIVLTLYEMYSGINLLNVSKNECKRAGKWLFD